MQAVIAHGFGAPSSFAVEYVPIPAPAEGEVRIAVAACGVSYLDALVSKGLYQVKPVLPFSPGSEFSGIVDMLGPNVTGLSVGDRVCASAVYGAFAEHVCVLANAVHRVPPTMSFEEAAIFGVSYATAYYALAQRASLQADETLFVLGAAGAIGDAAIQIGHVLGAQVIAGASTSAKRHRALANGAKSAIDTSLSDWRQELKKAAGQSGIDVVLDPVGGNASELAFRCLNWGGRHLVVGFASGKIASLPMNLTLLKGAAAVGVDLRQFNERNPVQAASNFSHLVEGYNRGQLRPTVGAIFPLNEFAAAMEQASSSSHAGRIVLRIQAVN